MVIPIGLVHKTANDIEGRDTFTLAPFALIAFKKAAPHALARDRVAQLAKHVVPALLADHARDQLIALLLDD